MRRALFLLVSCAVLASCGGGGSGGTSSGATGGMSTPTPSPAPAPTPTAIEKTAVGASVFATTQFVTVTGAATTLGGGATSGRSINPSNSAFAFSYDQTAKTYRLMNEVRSQTFGPTISNETASPDYFPRREYNIVGGPAADYLVMFKEANATPAISTDFSAYGAWQHNSNSSSSTDVRLDYFIYGTPTPVASMPHSGVHVYRVSSTGNFADDKELWFTVSYETISVDFATGAVTSNISLGGTNFFNGNFGGLLSFSYQGQVTGNAADGPLTFGQASYSGSAHLVFFGPNAENVGIIYSGKSPTLGSFNGAGVGAYP